MQIHLSPRNVRLLDLSMPVQSAWDAFEQLTAINPLLPIIITTISGRTTRLA